jgi:hypothetical protein
MNEKSISSGQLVAVSNFAFKIRSLTCEYSHGHAADDERIG